VQPDAQSCFVLLCQYLLIPHQSPARLGRIRDEKLAEIESRWTLSAKALLAAACTGTPMLQELAIEGRQLRLPLSLLRRLGSLEAIQPSSSHVYLAGRVKVIVLPLLSHTHSPLENYEIMYQGLIPFTEKT
jgi:hypothetical protein